MPTDINLLIQKQRGFFSQERLLLFSRVGAVVSVVLVLSLSILFFLLSRDPTFASIRADQSQTLAQLTLLQSKTAKYLLILDRIEKIKVIEKSMPNFSTTIATVVDQIPKGGTITNFVIDNNSLTLSVSSPDLSVLGKTVDNFMSLIASKKVLKTLTVQGLVSDEKSGLYVLSLTGDVL